MRSCTTGPTELTGDILGCRRITIKHLPRLIVKVILHTEVCKGKLFLRWLQNMAIILNRISLFRSGQYGKKRDKVFQAFVICGEICIIRLNGCFDIGFKMAVICSYLFTGSYLRNDLRAAGYTMDSQRMLGECSYQGICQCYIGIEINGIAVVDLCILNPITMLEHICFLLAWVTIKTALSQLCSQRMLVIGKKSTSTGG